MSNRILGSGYVGNDPELKTVTTDDGERVVTELRVCSTHNRRLKDGSFEQVDEIWLTVTAWGTLAEDVASKVKKGASIRFEGRLRDQAYEDESGKKIPSYSVLASDITLRLNKIENVSFKPRSERGVDLVAEAHVA